MEASDFNTPSLKRWALSICAASVAILSISFSPSLALEDLDGTLTVRFDGPVTHVHPELAGSFSIGDPFTAIVTYDTSTPDASDEVVWAGHYNLAILSVEIEVGSYTASSTGGNITVEDNGDPAEEFGRDGIFFTSNRGFGLSGAAIDELTPHNFLVQLVDHSETALSSTDLPTSIDTAAFNQNQLTLTFSTVPTSFGRAVSAETFTATVINDSCTPACGHIYWTDDATGKVQRSNLDGTGVEDLVTGLDAPPEIAVDPVEDKMYWVDFNAAKIQRANLDGSNLEDVITAQVVQNPSGLDIDVAAGKLYWVDAGTDKIQSANLDGSGIEDLNIQGLFGSRGFALDTTNATMYWTDAALGAVQRSNLDGTGRITIAQQVNFPTGVAVDPAGGKVYWVALSGDKIQRANLDGSDPEDLLVGLPEPVKIALDLQAGKMYWTELQTGVPNGGRIRRANLDGSEVEEVVTGLQEPLGIALRVGLAQTGKELLVSGIVNQVFRYDGSSGAFLDTFDSGGNPVTGMALGPDGLLYVGGGNNANVVRYNPITGELLDVFAVVGPTFEDRPEGLAFGPDGHLYVSVPNCNGSTCGVQRYDVQTGDLVEQVFDERAFAAKFDPAGLLYILGSDRIERYDFGTGVIENFISEPTSLLSGVTGFAFGPDGDIYLANLNPSRISRFDGLTGVFVEHFVTSDIELPHGITFGPDNNLYVGSWSTHDISRFDGQTGEFMDIFIASGNSLNKPTNLLFYDNPGLSSDTTPPVVTAPPDLAVEATGLSTFVEIGVAAATDNVGVVSLANDAPEGGFSLGTTVVTWSAADAAGNIGTAIQLVTVSDTTPPQLSVPDNIIVEATGPEGAAVIFPPPVAEDAVDPAPVVVANPSSGSAFELGSSVVIVTATDFSGNQSEVNFLVDVVDTTPPTLDIRRPFTGDVISESPALVEIHADDVVGVIGVMVNGIQASRVGDTLWEAQVPVELPVPEGGRLTFTAFVTDFGGNGAADTTIVDNDGIDAVIDRNKVTGADESLVYSYDFNNSGLGGTTAGTIVDRAGWIVEVVPATPNRVVARLSEPPGGAGGVGRIVACDVSGPEAVFLDTAGEAASFECRVNGSMLVSGDTALPRIEIRKPPTGGEAELIHLSQGQTVALGSPISAGADNTEPILVEIVDQNDVPSSSLQLDASESVDVSFTELGTAEVTLLEGSEVVVSSGGRTITLAEVNEPATVVVAPPGNVLSNMSQKIAAFVESGDIAGGGTANSLNASLNNAMKLVDVNNNATRGILSALVNKQEAFVNGNKISPTVRDTLVPSVQALIFSLE